MTQFTPQQLWSLILAGASALVLLSGAVEKIAKLIRAVRAPGAAQDDRLRALEVWQKEVDSQLRSDDRRLASIEEGNRATQRALLALLDHGIDGNNIEQMQNAKEGLQEHLIGRR